MFLSSLSRLNFSHGCFFANSIVTYFIEACPLFAVCYEIYLPHVTAAKQGRAIPRSLQKTM